MSVDKEVLGGLLCDQGGEKQDSGNEETFHIDVYDICMDRITPEPWLRGTIRGVDPLIAQLLYSFQQTLEDLEYFTRDLTQDQLWERPSGLAPVGFHMGHIAGSIERLLTYARGEQLTPAQLAALKSEMEPKGDVLMTLRERLKEFEGQIRAVDPATFKEERRVGRKELPTTVGALLVHIAEHTQRHLGQAIVTAKLVSGNRAAK